jgi:SAM-dependent methyltransferase
LSADERRHWDMVAADWSSRRPDRLWGQHADDINARYLARWFPTERARRTLKTDLFDEAWRQGMVPWLLPRTARMVGIDLSPVAVRSAVRRHGQIAAINADICHLPFGGGTFEIVVSNSTLDHFRDPDQIAFGLSELFRVLEPGGRLLLTLDNGANPLVALRNALPFPLLHRLGLVPYYVGVTWPPATLCRALAAVGFEVLDLEAIMHCPRLVAVWLARLLDRRAGAAARKRFLSAIMDFERLAFLPTRFLTAHFMAVHAVKPLGAASRSPGSDRRDRATLRFGTFEDRCR